MSDLVERLLGLLAGGQDSVLLRFGLGQALLAQGRAAEAATHLAAALAQDPNHSAAFKLLGKAHAECGDADAALAAWRRGLEVAEARGDKQAAREMGVFLRRLEKSRGER